MSSSLKYCLPLIKPLTCNLSVRLVVPIPTLPPYGFITISLPVVAALFTACIYCLELAPELIVSLLSKLLEDFTDNYGDITDYDAHRLKVVLKTHLGYKIYERGLGLLRQEFDTAFYDAITTLQRAVRRKIEKRQAKKVLEQKLKNIDCSISILPLISEWI